MIVKPFKGIRPPKALVEQVASRPYDVLNSEEARAEAEGNEKSLYHIIKPEIDFPVGTDEHDERVYAKAAENFQKFQDNGWLVQDAEDKYYVYAQTMNGRTQYGLVVCAAVEDYMTGKIKKHELTRRDKEEDRMKHVRVNNANIEPVFFAFPHQDELDAIVSKVVAGEPEYDFVAPDGFGHHFWVIDDAATIARITEIFAEFPAMYIADGHHRSAAAALVGDEKRKQNPNHVGDEEYNYFLAVCFPDNQLNIIDYNRVVKDLNGLTKEAFLEAIAAFNPQPVADKDAAKPKETHTFGMYLDGQWYSLAFNASVLDEDSIARLDVSILQKQLLEPILAIGDPRTDSRIDFVGGIRGLGELERRVDNGEMALAFAMFPTSVAELMQIADENKVMPPKSTWFEPKLRSGLIIHELV